jgi:hypothetical protein
MRTLEECWNGHARHFRCDGATRVNSRRLSAAGVILRSWRRRGRRLKLALEAAQQTCSRLVEYGGSFGSDDTEGPYEVQMYLVQREAGRLDRVRPLITGQESPVGRWAPG